MSTATTSRPARQQAVITGIAILIGAAVFALTSDFIIGVAVGAAFFALIGQIMRVLRPAPPGAPASQDPDRERAGR